MKLSPPDFRIRAWKGPHPKIPNTPVTIEIASLRGRTTRVRTMPPWAKPNPRPPVQASGVNRFRSLYTRALIVLILVCAAFFARRNWKLGRVDRKGALRLAIARFLVAILVWLGNVHAVPNIQMRNSAVELSLNGRI